MKKIFLLLALVLVLGGTTAGCKSSGSRDFVPGRGWVPND